MTVLPKKTLGHFPRRPSNSTLHSRELPGFGGANSSTNAGGRDCVLPRTGIVARLCSMLSPFLKATVFSFNFAYSKCRIFAVALIPCFRASSAAAPHKGSGIGKRPVCDLRY